MRHSKATLTLSNLALYFLLSCQYLLNLHVQLRVESVRYLYLHFFTHALPEHVREHLWLLGAPEGLHLLLWVHARQVSWQANAPRLTVIQ